MKFEDPSPIDLTSREKAVKERLQKEMMRREGLEESDASFKAMADMDGANHGDSKFDIDLQG